VFRNNRNKRFFPIAVAIVFHCEQFLASFCPKICISERYKTNIHYTGCCEYLTVCTADVVIYGDDLSWLLVKKILQDIIKSY